MASAYWTLLNSVQAQLQLIPSAPTVVIRRKLAMFQGDVPPLLIVAPGRGGEKPKFLSFPSPASPTKGNVIYKYPVAIAMILASNEGITVDLQAMLDLRELVRNQLFTVRSGVVQPAYDLVIDPQEVTEFGAFQATNYDVTGFGMSYDVAEHFN